MFNVLSEKALGIIDAYLHFKIGTAVCSVPYYNNKRLKNRAALRTYIGKGSPADIHEEIEAIMVKNRIANGQVNSDALKKLLVDNNLGIECSGFAYHVLDAESQSRGKGEINKHINFVNCTGLVGKLRCSLRPAENCDVATLAHDKNSETLSLNEVAPGDIITMTGDAEENERDHILVVHKVEGGNNLTSTSTQLPTQTTLKIHYSHAVAYPEDGVYSTGIRQGVIEVRDATKPITEAHWIEDKKEGEANRLFVRARKSRTEVRRLVWF